MAQTLSDSELVHLRRARLLGGTPRGRLEPVELGLAGDQLGLAHFDAVELGERVLCDLIAFRGLTLELFHAGSELACPSG